MALLHSGQPAATIDKLYDFIGKTNASDPFYLRALELAFETEAAL